MDKPFNRHLLIVLLAPIIIIILYSNTFNASFHLDDFENIIANRYIHITSLSPSVLKDVVFKSYAHRRPVASITFALNYYWGRLDPFGYHLVNIIIHIITAITLYFFIYNTLQIADNNLHSPLPSHHWGEGRERGIAIIATILWMTHPIQTQAVTFIVQRMAIMATMFYMLSLLCYVKGRQTIVDRIQNTGYRGLKGFLSTVYCLLSTVFALLAFGSKEISTTLPIVIVLYEVYFLARFDHAKIKKMLWIFGIIMIPLVMISIFYIKRDGDILKGVMELTSYRFVDNQGFTAIERLLTEFRVIIYYITLLILPLPSRLSLLKHFSISHSIFDPITTFFSIHVILGLVGYAIYIARRRPVLSFFIIWFFINLIIESSIIRLYLAYEHRLYLPSIAFFVIVAIGIDRLRAKSEGWSRKKTLLLPTFYCLLIGVIILQSLFTIQRNSVWIDEITLWRDSVKKVPDSVVGHNHLGLAYYKEDMIDLAIEEYKKSLMINSDYYWTHASLGLAYYRKGKIDMAIEKYKDALKIRPNWDTAHNDMGNLYLEKGEIESAIKEYKEAIRINPNNHMAHYSLGKSYYLTNRIEMAILEYQRTLQINPQYVELYYILGDAYYKNGDIKKAIEYYERFIRMGNKGDNYKRDIKIAREKIKVLRD